MLQIKMQLVNIKIQGVQKCILFLALGVPLSDLICLRLCSVTTAQKLNQVRYFR